MDSLHWAKTILDTIRVPLSDAVRLDEYDLQLIAGCAARAALGHSRLSEKLGVSVELREPVNLVAGLREIARLFTVSAYGKMTVTLDLDVEERFIRHHAWILIEGAVIELLWNAAKYGSTRDQRDVRATVQVRRGDPYTFSVSNDRPLDPDVKPPTRGVGLVTTPRRVAECGGDFTPLSSDGTSTFVRFTLPQRFVEDLHETGPHSHR